MHCRLKIRMVQTSQNSMRMKSLQTLIVECEKLIPELETQTEQLQCFVELVKAEDEILYAVPVDVMVLLVSFVKADALPTDFDWGGSYEPFFVEALREICTQQSSSFHELDGSKP